MHEETNPSKLAFFFSIIAILGHRTGICFTCLPQDTPLLYLVWRNCVYAFLRNHSRWMDRCTHTHRWTALSLRPISHENRWWMISIVRIASLFLFHREYYYKFPNIPIWKASNALSNFVSVLIGLWKTITYDKKVAAYHWVAPNLGQ